MPFHVCRVVEADLETISYLVFNAFAENPVHRVIYPNGATPSIIAWNIEGDRRGIKEDKHAHYMCVKDVDTGAIVSYALWYKYHGNEQQARESNTTPDCPPDANSDAFLKLDPISAVKRDKLMGNQSHMYLADLVTAPTARRQGAASLLLDWGKERADMYDIQCYLQGSPEGASLYKKHGFHEIDQVIIDLRPWNSPVLQVVNLAMVRPASSARIARSTKP